MPVQHLARGGYTVRWRVVSADSHVVAGVFTFGVRPARPARDPGVRRIRADERGARRPLALLPRARAADRRASASACSSCAARCRRGPSAASTGSWASARSARSRSGSSRSCCGREDALQLPFVDFLYGDLAPLAGGTRFGTAFVAMTLGFALVTALLYLAWLTERTWLLWAAFVLSLGFASGLSLSGHSAVDAGSSLVLGARRLGCISQRPRCGSAGSSCSPSSSGLLAPGLRRDAFIRFSKLATVLDRRPALGRRLPERDPAAAPRRPLERALRAGAARQARARVARAALGRRAPLPRAAAPSSGARRRSPVCRGA